MISFCGNNVIPPAWTLILPENWDESKTVFKGDADGFKIEEGRGRGEKLLSAPPLLVFSLAIQDGGRVQCTSEFSLKNACSAGYN